MFSHIVMISQYFLNVKRFYHFLLKKSILGQKQLKMGRIPNFWIFGSEPIFRRNPIPTRLMGCLRFFFDPNTHFTHTF